MLGCLDGWFTSTSCKRLLVPVVPVLAICELVGSQIEMICLSSLQCHPSQLIGPTHQTHSLDPLLSNLPHLHLPRSVDAQERGQRGHDWRGVPRVAQYDKMAGAGKKIVRLVLPNLFPFNSLCTRARVKTTCSFFFFCVSGSSPSF